VIKNFVMGNFVIRNFVPVHRELAFFHLTCLYVVEVKLRRGIVSFLDPIGMDSLDIGSLPKIYISMNNQDLLQNNRAREN
jgi:hypothetical protein